MLYFLLILMIAVSTILIIERNNSYHNIGRRSSTLKNKEDFLNTAACAQQTTPTTSSSSANQPSTKLQGTKILDEKLNELIIQSKRFEKPFAVMALSIDEYNLLIRNYGQEKINELFSLIGDRLKSVIRQVDSVIYYAGDKFIFLLPQLYMPETAVYVAQRLLDSIVLPFEIKNNKITLNACVGIAIYPFDGEDQTTLLRNAETALLQAKSLGKNLFQFYHQETQLLGKRELSLKTMIKSPAFLSNIVIDYQPYIDTQTKEI